MLIAIELRLFLEEEIRMGGGSRIERVSYSYCISIVILLKGDDRRGGKIVLHCYCISIVFLLEEEGRRVVSVRSSLRESFLLHTHRVQTCVYDAMAYRARWP